MLILIPLISQDDFLWMARSHHVKLGTVACVVLHLSSVMET